jgi:hypothetical protein
MMKRKLWKNKQSWVAILEWVVQRVKCDPRLWRELQWESSTFKQLDDYDDRGLEPHAKGENNDDGW